MALRAKHLLKPANRALRLALRLPGHLRRRRFPRAAEQLLDRLARGDACEAAYEDLFHYLVAGWVAHRTADCTRADYPGWPNDYDSTSDAIEGFSRIMPLFGAWCASGRPSRLHLRDGSLLSLPDAFRRGLVAGTDPQNPGYWGSAEGTNQRTVESADVALALWLFRATVWDRLTTGERSAVVDWLASAANQPGLDNNWHLFPVIVDRVLAALGHPGRIADVRTHSERIKAFHLGDGWFSDGPDGRIDYYNAWGFHYLLTWLDRIDPQWDPDFIRSSQRAFLVGYRHLIGPRGLPIMGRSIPYRMAAPAPLVAAAGHHDDIVSPGEARRALDATWHYFIRRGALRQGVPTQGYFGPDPRVTDRYSGPASSFWSLRSLVMAFWYPPHHPFWRSDPSPLAIEQRDYQMTVAGGRWRVHGDHRRLAIVIEVLDNPAESAPALEPFGLRQQLRGLMTGCWPRPHNLAAKYGRRYYRSDRPFCVIAPDEEKRLRYFGTRPPSSDDPVCA